MSNNISRRDFLKRTGLAGAGLALGGLGAGAVAAQDELVTIPSWWAPHEIEGAQAFLDAAMEGTGITPQYEYIGSDFFSKVFTNLVGNDPYDVITFNSTNTPQFLDRNILLPLDDLIARDGYDLSDFDPKAIEQWTYDGRLYGLANDMGTFHCYFNVDLFEEAGLTPPSPTDEWTWDDLREWAKALTKSDGDQITQYGFASGSNWNYEIWPNMGGEKVFNDDVSASSLASEANVSAFAFYQSLMHEDGTAVKPGSIQTGVNDLFLAGQLAIMLEGTWQVGYLRSKKDEANFTWDVGLPPRRAGALSYHIPNFTAGWVIPRVAPNVDASWEVMKAYASADFATEVMFTALSSLPTRVSALEGAGFYQWPDNPPQGITPEFYGLLLEHGLSRQEIGHTFSSSARAALAKLDLIYSGEAAPADILPEIDAELTAALGG